MANTIVPDSDHVARYCGFTKLDEKTGLPNPVAFTLRENEPDLSVHWLEFLSRNSRNEQITEAQNNYNRIMNKVGSTAIIAVLNVGGVRKYVSENTVDKRNLEVRHTPTLEEPEDPSHSGIYNVGHNEGSIPNQIPDLIAFTVEPEDVYPAKTIPINS